MNKYISFSLLLAATAFLSCSKKFTQNTQAAKSRTANSILVMTYNIHHCNPPSKEGVIDVEAVANVIREQNPDIVALQEVDVNTDRSKVNEAQQLADKTGMKYFFAKAIDHQNGEYGVAILSKYNIEEGTVHKLPMEPGSKREQRVLATAKITLKDGTSIRFGSTHLDAGSNPVDREYQIKEINRIASAETLPFIIAGDFNAVTGSTIINQLDQNFQRSCTVCGPTIPSDKPNKTIDFIAFKPKTGFRALSTAVIQAPYPSDHLPVTAILEYTK
ncbi:MAG: endonuclease/exonuclease/phosphatase [Sphingobacteriaceae bacterium]|jgi:endonuclease/exonuclease/phosphatase family metal-dependent hydrolase|nr:endonuclease/exonuclease/phosphatase [Sphingobacteriaceae bacterium]